MQRKHNIKFKLYRLSKMIPIFCMLTFLGICVISCNPTVNNQTFALEDSTEEDIISDEKDNLDESTENHDDLIAPQEDSAVKTANPTATITISKADGEYGADQNAATWVSGAGVAYRSHNVTVKAQDVMDYNLVISYANNTDRMSLVGGDAALLGAGDKTPTEMGYNSWGYAWTNTSAAEANLTYKTMPKISAGDTLESKMTYSEDFTKKLVFAAKFGSDATPGTYHTEVMLSLTASPQVVATTIKDIFQMQQMTPEICASTIVGETAVLQDSRGGGYDNAVTINGESVTKNNSYTVKKLSDGNCWMGQNLNLTNYTVTSADSNVAGETSYKIPESKIWATPSTEANYQRTSGAYTHNYNDYGTYYTWLTATAGTTRTGSDNANADICPKGWRLPTGGTSGEFQTLYTNGHILDGVASDGKSYAGWWLGGSNNNTIYFPAAGWVNSSGTGGFSEESSHWSSTASGNTSAYFMSLSIWGGNAGATKSRYGGTSVRCIAK